MHLADVQTYADERIKAVPALISGGDPIIYTPFVADEDARAAIDARLRSAGYCIEIGSPDAEGVGEQPNPRMTKLDATFDVLVAESPTVAHDLKGLALVSKVAEAVQARKTTSEPNPRCMSYQTFTSEHGYILHVLSFTVPVLL